MIHLRNIAVPAVAIALAMPAAMMAGCGKPSDDKPAETTSETEGQLFDEFGSSKGSKKDDTKGKDKGEEMSTGSKGGEEDADENAADAKVLQGALSISDDSALGAASTLDELGVGDLASAKIVPGTTHTVQVTDVYGKTYVIEFSQMGYLHVVRADSVDGEVIYGVVE